MADLDDFFAKKDKKKSKAFKKFSTTEEVVKKLEDSSKKVEKLKKERSTTVDGEDSGIQEQDQDEWKEFEEEKKDYSGLKIGNLTLAGDDNPSGTADYNEDSDASPEEVGADGAERKAGPWKQLQVEKEVIKEEVVANVVEAPVETTEKKGGSVYVAPHLRNQPAKTPLKPTRLKSRTAPDIHNEEFFPTLSKGSEPKKNRDNVPFEIVQSGRGAGVTRESSKDQVPKLNLENRYNTLSENS